MASRSTRAVPRFPQARVLRNSELLLDSGIALLAAGGWGALNFSAVAARAGLSPRPLRDRYVDVPALAGGLWTERARPALSDALLRLLAAAGQLDDGPSETALVEVLDELAHPDEVLLAAGELLVVSQFEALLRGAVGETLGRQVHRWCAPHAGRLSATQGARRAYLLCLGLGLVLAGRRPGAEGYTMRAESPPLLKALAAEAIARKLPAERADQLNQDVPFETGDPLRDALLQATLDEVAQRGYEQATTQRIVEAVGVTEGALFARYATKLELFADATARQHAITYRANDDWLNLLAERYGTGIAEAISLREYQRPEHAHLRALNLEQLRVTWHDSDLRAAHVRELDAFTVAAYSKNASRAARQRTRAHVHSLFAHGLGANLLPHLYPGCWKLPYDVVTAPRSAALE